MKDVTAVKADLPEGVSLQVSEIETVTVGRRSVEPLLIGPGVRVSAMECDVDADSMVTRSLNIGNGAVQASDGAVVVSLNMHSDETYVAETPASLADMISGKVSGEFTERARTTVGTMTVTSAALVREQLRRGPEATIAETAADIAAKALGFEAPLGFAQPKAPEAPSVSRTRSRQPNPVKPFGL